MIFQAFDARRAWALAALLLSGSASWGQTVAMTGGMGSRALLVVNGGAPKALSAGQVYLGVKVVSVGPEQTVVEMAGQRQTVALGGSPVSLGGHGGAASSGGQIVLTAGSGGHFMTQGSINGRSVNFLVDTGATTISLGAEDARRIGIKFADGRRVMTTTANGQAPAYLVKLDSVRIKDVEVFDVQALVSEASMPFVLLGNSFLTRFQMKRDNDQLTLTKRF